MKTSRPNIILITIDCLRFDHLGCYGYYRRTSPNIDNLASRGALFLQAISNGGQTPFAFPSILASALPPLEMHEDKDIMRRSTTLAEVLKAVGYHTVAFQSTPNLMRAFNYAKGFDTFRDNLGRLSTIEKWKIMLTIRLAPLVTKFSKSVSNFLRKLWRLPDLTIFLIGGKPTIAAEELTRQVISELIAYRSFFFLWLHYMDVHAPYMPPLKYRKQFCDRAVSWREMVSLHSKMRSEPETSDQMSSSEIDTLVNLYDASIKYVDDAIGQLLDSLGSALDDTIVVVTADHGDEFGEHGKFSHHTLYDGIIHVPLIIAGPGVNGDTVVKEQVSLLDLPPTIASLAGIENVHGFFGESLLKVMKGEHRNTRGTVATLISPKGRVISYRIPEWKYIRTESLDAASDVLIEEVYDLTNDPGETRNLHGMDMEESKRFESEAVKKVAEFRQLRLRVTADYERQRIKAKLSKLGEM